MTDEYVLVYRYAGMSDIQAIHYVKPDDLGLHIILCAQSDMTCAGQNSNASGLVVTSESTDVDFTDVFAGCKLLTWSATLSVAGGVYMFAAMFTAEYAFVVVLICEVQDREKSCKEDSQYSDI